MAPRLRLNQKRWWAIPTLFASGTSHVTEADSVNALDFDPMVAFQKFDQDRSGVLNDVEFRTMCADLALDEEDASNMDLNRDGVVTPQEFAAYLSRKFPTQQQEQQVEETPPVPSNVANFVVQQKQQQETILGAAPSTKDLAARLTNGPGTGGAVCGEGGQCSGHGVCDTGAGTCNCQVGFSGGACEVQQCPGFAESGTDCYANGACHGGKCECADGYGTFPNRSVPLDCRDKICQFPCGDHGKCVDGYCLCFQGWTGQMCRDPDCPGGCSGHGSCMMQTLNGPGECTCDYGWAGAACHRPAVYAQQKPCPLDCDGNGLCMNGLCLCNVGFNGPACSNKECPAGKGGPDCQSKLCPLDCTGRGLCFDGECSCQEGWTGMDCSIPQQCLTPCRDACGGPTGGKETEVKCIYCIGQCLTNKNPFLGHHDPFNDLRSTLLQASHHPNAAEFTGNATKKLRG